MEGRRDYRRRRAARVEKRIPRPGRLKARGGILPFVDRFDRSTETSKYISWVRLGSIGFRGKKKLKVESRKQKWENGRCSPRSVPEPKRPSVQAVRTGYPAPPNLSLRSDVQDYPGL